MANTFTRNDDKAWVRGLFGLGPFAKDLRNNSTPRTSADFKFGDTTIGGNQAINPPPQGCRFADIKGTGLFARTEFRDGGSFENQDNSGSFQMGRNYSEVIDDNSQYIHIRPGVPKYVGSIVFFANNYDRNAARLANKGEFHSIFRDLGLGAGLAAMFIAIPFAVIVPLVLTSKILGFVSKAKPSKYYYVKPTPHLYWQAVQSMVDNQLVHHHLVPMVEPFNSDRFADVKDEDNKLSESMKEAQSQLPDIWRSNGTFDVFKMANRYQVLANYQAKTIESIYEAAGSYEEYQEALKQYIADARAGLHMKKVLNDEVLSLKELSFRYANNPLYQIPEDDEAKLESELKSIEQRYADSKNGVSAQSITEEQDLSELKNAQAADNAAKGGSTASPEDASANLDKAGFWGSFLADVAEGSAAEVRDGAQWVSFRVDNKEQQTDTFNNSTKEPDIAGALNGMSSKARSIDFATSGGNTGFDLVDGAMGAAKEFLGGALEAFHLTGLMAIYGKSYVDIPEVWDSASADIASQSYTLQLRSPYGNDLSLFQNITVPLCMVLAMALPLSTGKQSFTRPFHLEAYSRGRLVTRNAIITDISVTRGVGNMGWRPDGKMLGCDISITIKDLSSIMHMPLMRDPGIFDDDSKYSEYMAMIGGASLHELTFAMDRLLLNVTKWKQSWKSAFNPGRISSEFGASFAGQALAGILGGQSK